jgi:hypothetical protein
MMRLGAYLRGDLPPPDDMPEAAHQLDLFLPSAQVIGFAEALDLASARMFEDRLREQRFRDLCEGSRQA